MAKIQNYVRKMQKCGYYVSNIIHFLSKLLSSITYATKEPLVTICKAIKFKIGLYTFKIGLKIRREF